MLKLVHFHFVVLRYFLKCLIVQNKFFPNIPPEFIYAFLGKCLICRWLDSNNDYLLWNVSYQKIEARICLATAWIDEIWINRCEAHENTRRVAPRKCLQALEKIIQMHFTYHQMLRKSNKYVCTLLMLDLWLYNFSISHTDQNIRSQIDQNTRLLKFRVKMKNCYADKLLAVNIDWCFSICCQYWEKSTFDDCQYY